VKGCDGEWCYGMSLREAVMRRVGDATGRCDLEEERWPRNVRFS
jgi:hypothetical protein